MLILIYKRGLQK